MKKVLFLSILVSTFLFSCNLREELEKREKAKLPPISPIEAEAQKLIGAYEGTFIENKSIHLVVSIASADSIYGGSTVAGKYRPFVGLNKHDKGVFTVTAKEPGDDPTDGKFVFMFDTKQPDVIKGSWIPDSVTKKVDTVDYTLNRKKFVYNSNVGIYPHSSTREISGPDMINLSAWELQVMKNEIYARHGLIFTDKKFRDAFESKTWYVPAFTDVKQTLTELENKNIETIDSYK